MSFLESLNVKCGPKCHCRTPKRKQFPTIKCKVQNNRKYKKRRQVLRQPRKQNKKGNPNIPGRFSTKIIPYVDFTSHGSVSQIQTSDVCKTITFVSDVDVQAFITDFHNK